MRRVLELARNSLGARLKTGRRDLIATAPKLGSLMIGRNLARQSQLCRIIAHAGWSFTKSGSKADACTGWGRKPSSVTLRDYARQRGLPFLALEDGFLRSIGLGSQDYPLLSLILDPVGIYYDATTPSHLENMLNDPSCFVTDALLARASAGRLALQKARISKYNGANEPLPAHLRDGDYVLLIDQVRGDESIQYGLADLLSFERMLEAARREFPQTRIVIKTHPGAFSDPNGGHFQRDTQGVTFVDAAINPWDLMLPAKAVYTVTSGMGFEALLAEKKVRCFGMPFYAGWGLTEDELSCARRIGQPSLDMLFAAAYLKYPIYYDQMADQLCEFERALEQLSHLRDENEKNRQPTFCLGISKWKQKTVTSFLRSHYQKPVFLRSSTKAIAAAKQSNGRVVIWASRSNDRLEQQCLEAGVPLLRMEDGFLRSKGLGSDLIQPASLVLDATGIYYDPTRPSDLETLIAKGEFSDNLLQKAEDLRQRIISSGLTKYNVGTSYQIPGRTHGRRTILVPGQVADDASVRTGTAEINTNWKLLEATRRANPDAFIIYKPHPDIEAGNRNGFLAPHRVLSLADYIASELSSDEAINQVDEVWTMTSLLGFEALLRGKKVTCLGMPFYAGWGLTDDHMTCPRRGVNRSLLQVMAATYLIYPKYNETIRHFLPGPLHEIIRKESD